MDDIIEIPVTPKETKTTPKKTLTPKRSKLSNEERLEREREREEKAKQKQEEKERKVQERLKKEQEKRQQEEEQRQIREQREKERLEKLQRKQEEKDRKLQERLDKENAKKQIEQKQNRVSEKFKQFFVPKNTHDLSANGNGIENVNGTGNLTVDGESKSSIQTFFKPFVLKNGMKLAPIHRYFWSSHQKDQFSKLINNEDFVIGDQYLIEMKSNKAKGCNYSPISSHSQMDVCLDNDVEIVKTNEKITNDDDDDDDEDDENIVRIIDRSKKCEKIVKPKLIQFHDNRRPAYFGTFQKKSKIVNGRRPYRCDRTLFDYEFDSDLEWCEEDEEVAGCGGGEQLKESDHEEDDEEVASGTAGAHSAANDDYEVDNDFFVPHGYLSEDEEMNADDNEKVTKEKLEELEKEFVSEIKSETKKLKPTLCGLFWQDAAAFSDLDNAPKIPKTLLKNRIAFDQELIKSIPILASFPKT